MAIRDALNRPSKLMTRLLVPIGLTIIALLSLILVLEREDLNQLSLRAVAATHDEAAQRAMLELDSYLSDTERLVSTHRTFLDPDYVATEPDLGRLVPALWAAFSIFERTGAVYFGRADDEFVGYRRLQGGRIQFMESGAATDFEVRFRAVDDAGRPLAVESFSAGFRSSTRPWYLAARDVGSAVWSEPFEYQAFPVVAVPYSEVVRGADGSLVGVAAGNVFLSGFESFLQSLDLASGAAVFVVDRTGRIIASSSPQADSLLPILNNQIDNAAVPEDLLRVGDQRLSVRRQQVEGHRGAEWTLFSVVDIDAFVRDNAGLIQASAPLLAMALALVGIIAVYFVVRGAVRPLGALADSMSQVAVGAENATTLVKPPSPGRGASSEARALHHSFAAMTTRIEGLLERQRDDLQQLSALNEELDLFGRIVRETSDMVIITDAGGAIRWVNEEFEQHTGWPLADCLGRRPDEFLEGPDTDRVEGERVRAALASGQPVEARLLYHRRDGSPYWAEFSIQPVDDPTAGVPGYFSVQRDVTSRIRYEERLSLWQRVFEAANWGIVLSEGADPPLIRDANSAFARMFGSSPEAIIGRPVTDLYHGKRVPNVAALSEELNRQGHLVFEAEFQRADGTSFPGLVNLTRVGEEGGLETRIANIQDLSELRALEHQLIESNRLEEVGLLAGGVIHDLNNLLSIIQLNSEYGSIKTAGSAVSGDAKLAKMFAEIKQSCERAADVTRQFLMFTRRSSQGFQVVALGEIINDVVSMVTARARDEAEILVRVSEQDGRVAGNAGQLRQVFLNLVTNALDAVQDGGTKDARVEIVVNKVPGSDYFPLAEDREWVRVDVVDNGPGIPTAVRGRLFEPLFTTKQEGKGTGLGLTIVQRIVEDHDGYVNCVSEDGGGTRFSLWLPYAEGGAAVMDNVEEARPAVKSDGSNPAVLLVDDEVEVTRLWRKLLADQPWELALHDQPQQALDEFMSQPERFDVLVTDLDMPGMSGVELVRAVRATNPAIPVLVCTAHLRAEAAQELNALGVAAILDKPVSSRTLVRSIELVLSELSSGG